MIFTEATWNFSKSEDWNWEFGVNTCSERERRERFEEREGITNDGEGAHGEEGSWGIPLY